MSRLGWASEQRTGTGIQIFFLVSNQLATATNSPPQNSSPAKITAWFCFTQTDHNLRVIDKFYFIEWLTFHNWEATHKYITSESLSLLQYITAEFPIRDSIRDLVCDPIRSNPGGISYSVIFFVLIIAFYERISSSRYVTISDSLWIRNDCNLIH